MLPLQLKESSVVCHETKAMMWLGSGLNCTSKKKQGGHEMHQGNTGVKIFSAFTGCYNFKKVGSKILYKYWRRTRKMWSRHEGGRSQGWALTDLLGGTLGLTNVNGAVNLGDPCGIEWSSATSWVRKSQTMPPAWVDEATMGWERRGWHRGEWGLRWNRKEGGALWSQRDGLLGLASSGGADIRASVRS